MGRSIEIVRLVRAPSSVILSRSVRRESEKDMVDGFIYWLHKLFGVVNDGVRGRWTACGISNKEQTYQLNA